jgi:stage IV sporulation protein FB
VNRGWLTIGHYGDAPIRLHWSLPIGAVVLSRFQFVPGYWLGFVLLILLHECGHALLVLRYRLGLTDIAVHGLGGWCRHAHSGTPFQASAVAWGGVLAQLCVLAGAYAVLLLAPPLSSPFVAELMYAFTDANLWLIALNLIPIEPLDGAKAWQIVPMLMARFRKRAVARGPLGQRRSVKDELKALEKLDTQAEQPSDKTDRIVRDLISRTTQSKR